MHDDLDLSRRDYNAGSARTLDEVQALAQTRATAIGQAVGIYQHIGGRSPNGHPVPATNQYLWRDLADELGRPLGTPKRYYRDVETVQP